MDIQYFISICKKTQEKLKADLAKQLKKKYETVIVDDGFIFAKGTLPICLVAHLDTVHKETPKTINIAEGKISSPEGIGGDDRCGVYAIMKIIETHKCSVLFCEDEEIGMVGAEKFVQSKYMDELSFNYMIEIDRTGKNDAVFYDCENDEFTSFILKDNDLVESFGTFSDISILAPELKCAAVNISSGYYNAHTAKEFVIIAELDKTISTIKSIIKRTKDTDQFVYIESKRDYLRAYGEYDGYGMYGDERVGKYRRKWVEQTYYVIEYRDELKRRQYYDTLADNEYEAIGMCMMENANMCYNDVISIEEYPYC